MTREHLKTADGDILAELNRVTHLFQRALPDSGSRLAFDHLMNEAAQRGLSWVDALEYVIEQRHLTAPDPQNDQ
jgi:hypothetical protein